MWQRRRDSILQSLKKRGAALILPTHPEFLRAGDSHFRYRTSSDFYYLTGFDEPESLLVLNPFLPENPYILFVRPRDVEMETWNGRRAGLEGAKRDFGAHQTFDIAELSQRLPEFLAGASDLYYPLGLEPERDTQILRAMQETRPLLKQGFAVPQRISSVTPLLHEMRLFKDQDEIQLMQKSADIASEAHILAMRATKPGMHEYEIEALIEYHFRRSGGIGPAYPSIVGGGENATILHYVKNKDVLNAGELLLVDAGCEYDYYCSDITRTWPVNGKFTPIQKDAYEVVLAAQLAAIDAVRPGHTFIDAHEAALLVLTQGMLDLGLITGCTLDEAIETERYKPFYMHKTGHWLGLDVHDAGDYREGDGPADRTYRFLEPGMITTVEPGLYIPADCPSAPEGLKGTGIRIEDDVLVTAEAPHVLTAKCPKTIAEIEALVGSD